MSTLYSMLTSCSDATQDLKNYISAVKQRRVQPMDPLPRLNALEPFTYPEHALIPSPFQGTGRVKTLKNSIQLQSNKIALQVYPVEALKFMGTLTSGGFKWALIKSPDNQLVKIGVGDTMGKDKAQVLLITESNVQLETKVKDNITTSVRQKFELTLDVIG